MASAFENFAGEYERAVGTTSSTKYLDLAEHAATAGNHFDAVQTTGNGMSVTMVPTLPIALRHVRMGDASPILPR